MYDTKNGEDRVIALTDEIAAELHALPAREGLVFGYAHKRGVYRALQRVCGEAGLEYLGTHGPAGTPSRRL